MKFSKRDKNERVEKNDKTEKIDNAEKNEKIEKNERLDKNDKSEKSEKSESKSTDSTATKARRFPRFGIIDAVIIILIIAVAIGLAFKYNIFNTFSKLQDHTDCAVTFSVKDIENDTQFYINNGDIVYFKETGKNFGAIMESSEASSVPLTIAPASKTFVENGSVIHVNYPKETRIDAIGRIKCEGNFSSDGTFLLNGSDYISPGQLLTVCTEKVTLQITVVSIEAIEE